MRSQVDIWELPLSQRQWRMRWRGDARFQVEQCWVAPTDIPCAPARLPILPHISGAKQRLGERSVITDRRSLVPNGAGTCACGLSTGRSGFPRTEEWTRGEGVAERRSGQARSGGGCTAAAAMWGGWRAGEALGLLLLLAATVTTPTLGAAVRVSTQWALLEAFTTPEVEQVILAANLDLINSAIWPPSGLPVTSAKSLVSAWSPSFPCFNVIAPLALTHIPNIPIPLLPPPSIPPPAATPWNTLASSTRRCWRPGGRRGGVWRPV